MELKVKFGLASAEPSVVAHLRRRLGDFAARPMVQGRKTGMDPDDLKEMAVEAVESLRHAALYDGDTYTTARNGVQAIEMCSREIIARIHQAGSSHPNFDCMGETAAALVLLAATDRDTYALLIGGIAPESEVNPANRAGLRRLSNLLNAVSDDHEYILDRSGSMPVIRMSCTVDRFEPTMSPRTLLEAVLPLLELSSRRHAPEG